MRLQHQLKVHIKRNLIILSYSEFNDEKLRDFEIKNKKIKCSVELRNAIDKEINNVYLV